MSDIIDQANDRAQRDLDRAIAAARNSNGIEPGHTGHCLNCGEHVSPPKRWCDAECLADWQMRNPRGVGR